MYLNSEKKRYCVLSFKMLTMFYSNFQIFIEHMYNNNTFSTTQLKKTKNKKKLAIKCKHMDDQRKHVGKLCSFIGNIISQFYT